MRSAPKHVSAKLCAMEESQREFARVVLRGYRLEALEPQLCTVDRARLQVLGAFPQQCYAFARKMAEQQPASGFYCEGLLFTILDDSPQDGSIPLGHAWFETADGAVVDGTTTSKNATRVGLRIPSAVFQRNMASADFRAQFDRHDPFPFARAALRLGMGCTD